MIDKVPMPPTDNLYKMMTFAGMFLLALGVLTPEYLHVRFAERYDAEWKDQARIVSQRSSADKNAASQTEFEWKLLTTAFERDYKRLNCLEPCFIGMSVMGAFIMFAGWLAWRFLFQNHQDALVKL